MRDTSKLTIGEEKFVDHYVAHGNAKAAAIFAGYSEKTAHAKGSELSKRPRVVAAIAAKKARIGKKLDITSERVVAEMGLISFSSVRNYVIGVDGYFDLAPGVDASAWRAVKKLKYKTRLIPQKDGMPPVAEVEGELELWSKDTQLGNLANYFKLFKENRADGEADDGVDEMTASELAEQVIGLFKTAVMRKKQAKRATR